MYFLAFMEIIMSTYYYKFKNISTYTCILLISKACTYRNKNAPYI